MPALLTSFTDLIRRVIHIASPFGKRKLVVVVLLSFVQGLFQVASVTSVFPLLALAANPGAFRSSKLGQWTLDQLPEMDNRQLLLAAGLLAIVMLLVANAVNLFGQWNRARYTSFFGHWLRLRLFRNITRRSYGTFLQENTSVLLKKVSSDVSLYSGSVLLPLLDSTAQIITILLLTISMVAIDPQLVGSAALFLALFYGMILIILGKWRERTARELVSSRRGIMNEAKQTLDGIKAVKIHRAEEFFVDRFRGFSRRYAALRSMIAVVTHGPRYLIEPIAFGGLVAIVLVRTAQGGSLIELLPVLGVLALAGYRILPNLQLLYSNVTQLTTMRGALDEIYDEFVAVCELEERDSPDLECQQESLPEPAPPWKRNIVFEGVKFRYPSASAPIIDGLRLTLPKQTSLGVVGQTGCGKSTFADLLLGLHRPTEGRILLDGVPLSRRSHIAFRRSIGYVPQDIYLIDDTVAANIAFGLNPDAYDRKRLRESAAAAQILDFIETDLPDGWETQVGERGVRLSGGQRQRIGLARALFTDPELLILDEATSALDIRTEEEVMKAVNALQESITVVIITHRTSTIRGVDQVLDLSTLAMAKPLPEAQTALSE